MRLAALVLLNLFMLGIHCGKQVYLDGKSSKIIETRCGTVIISLGKEPSTDYHLYVYVIPNQPLRVNFENIRIACNGVNIDYEAVMATRKDDLTDLHYLRIETYTNFRYFINIPGEEEPDFELSLCGPDYLSDDKGACSIECVTYNVSSQEGLAE